MLQSPVAKLISTQKLPGNVKYVDYNKKSIKTDVNLTIPMSSKTWKNQNAQFMVSENRIIVYWV